MSSEPIHWAHFPASRLDTVRTEPIPAAGVMFHLLGAVGLGWCSLVWGLLAALGVVSASVVALGLAATGLFGSIAWARWLLRVTEARATEDELWLAYREPFGSRN